MEAPRAIPADRERLSELAERLSSFTLDKWPTRAIELRQAGRIARLAREIHAEAKRLITPGRQPAIAAHAGDSSSVLTADEHDKLVARLEELLQCIDATTGESPALFARLVQIDVAALNLAVYARELLLKTQ
jgi:hypothetical protein